MYSLIGIGPGVFVYGVRADMADLGVLGVPGIGSEKCSLNHLNKEFTDSKNCPLNLNPFGVMLIYSCLHLALGK